MTYDPFYHYEEDEKKRKRWDSLLPVFVAAIVLLVGFYGFFVAYQRSHAKPKPYTVTAMEGEGTWGQGHAVGVYGTSGGGWLVKEAVVDRPKRHKRKHHQKTQRLCDSSGHCEYMAKFHLAPSPYDWNWHIISTVPSEMWCEKPKGAEAFNCMSRPLTPDEIKMYQPEPKWETGHTIEQSGDHEKAVKYDELALDHDQVFYDDVFVPSGGSKCSDREAYRRLQCVSGGKCKERNRDVSFWCSPEPTTPQDITNLMEQIAPTKPKVTQSYDGCNTTTYADGVAISTTSVYCPPKKPIVEWNCGAGNCGVAPKPDCKMPADVDVCPDTIDPKAADDSDSKNRARQSLATAMLICAENPNATPSIILKDGPTPVPCATLKWAVDSVEADDKKGKP